jgi:integrase
VSGSITRRGIRSWRVKFEAGDRDPDTGKRQTRYITVRGTKKDAQRELIRLLGEVENGTAVDPSRVMVTEYLRAWLEHGEGLSPKTLERYRQLAEQQIIPDLGAIPLQKLRPAQVQGWHGLLLKSGGKDRKPLSARTVGHSHRVLHGALERAMRLEIISRNAARPVPPPKVAITEATTLNADQISEVLMGLQGYGGRYGSLPLHPIAVLAIGTGMRRGEICGLSWGAVDLDKARVRIECSLEETADGLRFKSPKTAHGRRTVSLPASAVATLREHRNRQLEHRLALGLGRSAMTIWCSRCLTARPIRPTSCLGIGAMRCGIASCRRPASTRCLTLTPRR